MTDAEIEQERKSLEAPIEPLYVDKLADERNAAVLRELVRVGAIEWYPSFGDLEEEIRATKYKADGSMVRPFLTLDEARAVQKPGQSIVIAGYATIGAAAKPYGEIPKELKERCS